MSHSWDGPAEEIRCFFPCRICQVLLILCSLVASSGSCVCWKGLAVSSPPGNFERVGWQGKWMLCSNLGWDQQFFGDSFLIQAKAQNHMQYLLWLKTCYTLLSMHKAFHKLLLGCVTTLSHCWWRVGEHTHGTILHAPVQVCCDYMSHCW